MYRIELTTHPIVGQSLLDAVIHPDGGGTVLFLGTVREHTGDERTIALVYEAFEPMALAKMHSLAEEIANRWPIKGLAMVHRLGRLEIGEISVAIAINCPHRAQAFDACEYAIDRLKVIVPIWKQDVAGDGASRWVHPDAHTNDLPQKGSSS